MSSNITTARAAATILLIAGAPMALADAPTIDPADDAKHFGPLDRVMFWEPAQKVAGFRNAERLFLTRRIEAGDTPYPLPDSPVDLSPMQFEYRGESYGFADYIKKSNVAGLIVIQDGKVLDESYYLGNSRNTRWVSFSVTKSLTSMLLGAAIEDGYIGDLDEAITDYLPRLKGSLYDGVTIRNLLQMASGIDWNEDYEDPQSDVNTYPWYDVLALFGYLDDKQRVAAPGAEFRYNSAETDLVGSVVRAAIGNNLSTYLEKKIWKPFGMESDTNWLLGAAGGAEIGGCCVSATLRDYARIGLFALRGGELPDGTRVLPSGWMRESTTPSAAFRGYGFLWWLNDDGSYEARGVFGQTVYINPRLNLVIAKHAVWDKAFDVDDLQFDAAFFRAVADALKD